jgi:hypothetical protein
MFDEKMCKRVFLNHPISTLYCFLPLHHRGPQAITAALGDAIIGAEAQQRPIRVGDEVRVVLPEGRTSPSSGWGSANADSVGVIVRIDGTSVRVDFPEQSGWNGSLDEMALVSGDGDDVAQAAAEAATKQARVSD